MTGSPIAAAAQGTTHWRALANPLTGLDMVPIVDVFVQGSELHNINPASKRALMLRMTDGLGISVFLS